MTDIILAYADDALISPHRTLEGAARAIADDVRTRLAKTDRHAIADDEHAAIRRHVVEHGRLDLNQGRGLDVGALGAERTTAVAFHVNRLYTTRTTPLRD